MPSMQSAPTGSRRLPVRARVALPVVVAILAFAGVACAPPGSPGSGYTGDMVSAVNQDRAAAGPGPLGPDRTRQHLVAWRALVAAISVPAPDRRVEPPSGPEDALADVISHATTSTTTTVSARRVVAACAPTAIVVVATAAAVQWVHWLHPG